MKSNFLQPPRTKRSSRISHRWAQQTLCRAKKKNGQPCRGKATISGYCGYHTKRFRQPKKLKFGWKADSPLDPRKEIIIINCPTYKDYLKTYHWQIVRKYALEFYKYKCSRCKRRAGKQHPGRILSVHHNNYDCLWEETPRDVMILCHKCHGKLHDDSK